MNDRMLHIFTDGASRGNPGQAAIGVVISEPSGALVEEISEAIGLATNNVAEYTALIRGLERALQLGAGAVQVFCDSELMVRQLRGVYKVRNEGLIPLYEKAKTLLSRFERASVTYVPRERNSRADELANRALDMLGAEGVSAVGSTAAALATLDVPGVRDAGVSQRRASRQAPFWLVDAFTEKPLSGNPAGVVLDADGLSEEEMQAIAREVNASETVFVLRPSLPAADFRTRFFSPVREVDLCGHATIAAFYLLGELGRLNNARQGIPQKKESASPPTHVPGCGQRRDGLSTVVRQQTRAGIFPVEIQFGTDGRVSAVYMSQPQPQFRAYTGSLDGLAGALGVSRDAIERAGLPVGCAWTGLWHLMVPVMSLGVLGSLAPDQVALARLNEAVGVVTTHVFTIETMYPESTAHSRSFAPLLGIAEDPQTGTASGALAAYLLASGVTVSPQDGGWVRMVFEQGHFLGRGGLIYAEVKIQPHDPRRVLSIKVGGKASVAINGNIYLPNI